MTERSNSQQPFESNKSKSNESNVLNSDWRTADLNNSDIPLDLTVDYTNSQQPNFDSHYAGLIAAFNREYLERSLQKVQKVESNESSMANANKIAFDTQNAFNRAKSYGFMSGVSPQLVMSPPLKPIYSTQNSFNQSAALSATAAGNVGLNMSMANAKNIYSSGVASAGFMKVSLNKEDAPWFKKSDQCGDSYAHPKYTERTSSPQYFPYNEVHSTSSSAVARSMPPGFIGGPVAHQILPTDRFGFPLSAMDHIAHHSQSINNNVPPGFMGPINMELPIGQTSQMRQPNDGSISLSNFYGPKFTSVGPHVQPPPTLFSSSVPESGGCELSFQKVHSTLPTTPIMTTSTQDSNKVFKDTFYCRQVPSIYNTNPLMFNSPQQVSDQYKILSPHDNTTREQHITDNNIAISGRGKFFAGLMDCPANDFSAGRFAAAGDGNSMSYDRLQARSSVGQWSSLQEGSFIRSSTNSMPKTALGSVIDKDNGAGGDTVAASLNFFGPSYNQPKAAFVLNNKDFPALNKRNKRGSVKEARTPYVETTTANFEKPDMVFPVQANPLLMLSRAAELVALAKLKTKDEEFSTVFGQQYPEYDHGSSQRNDVKPEVQLRNMSSAMKTNQLPAFNLEAAFEALNSTSDNINKRTNSPWSGNWAQTNEHFSVLNRCPIQEKFPVQQDLKVSGTQLLEPKFLYQDDFDVTLTSGSISEGTYPPEPKSENKNSNVIQDQYGLLGLAAAIEESKKNADISQWLFGSPLETLQSDLPERNMFDKVLGFPQESRSTSNWFNTLPHDFLNKNEHQNDNNQYKNPTLPDCYKFDDKLRSNLPKMLGFTSLTDDQLFLIFYTQPKTVNQLLAAAGLYDHGWFYFLGNNIWMRKKPQSQVQHNAFGGATANAGANANASVSCAQCEVAIEKGVFECFDAISWRTIVGYLEIPISLIDKYPDLSSISSSAP